MEGKPSLSKAKYMTEPAHILVVDDDPSIRRMLQLLLTDAGYRISMAASGEEALSYVDLVTPDLILLDMMLPGINGREVAQRVKSDPQRPFIPIILVTARSDSQSKVSGLDAGADDFLSKPVEFAELLARVRALLRLQRSQRSLRAEQRKTELLLHLTRELGTTLDLDDLLTHFLERLSDAVGAARANIILTANEQTRFYSSTRLQPNTVGVEEIINSGIAGWVLREKQPVVVADTYNDQRWAVFNTAHRAIRSVAAAPILRDNRALGVITLVHHTPNHFSVEHLDLLTSVAAQSAFTLENTELYRLTRVQKDLLERRTEELQRLSEVSHHLSELMQPELLLRLVTHLIHYTFGYPQVSILLREESTLVVRAIAGRLDPDSHIGVRVPEGHGITNWVAEHRQTVIVPDVEQEPRYFRVSSNDGVRSEMAVPIYTGRELFGVLDVMSDSAEAFGANDERLLGTLASQLGVALDNARLFDAEKRRVRQLDQVNALSVAITARLDLERNLRIATDALATIFGVDRSAIIVFGEHNRPGMWVASSKAELQFQDHSVVRALIAPNATHVDLDGAALIEDVQHDERFTHLATALRDANIISLGLAPLVSGGRRIGVVAIDVSGRTELFGQAEMNLLATVASLIGQVMENTRLYGEVEDERRTLNAVLDGAADPILLIGPQEHLLLSNRAADQHLGVGAASGQLLSALIQQSDLLRALSVTSNGSGPHEVTLPPGNTFSISVAPVHSGKNELLGRVAVMQDITAIKELERREQERLRGVLRRYVSPQVVEQMLAGGSDFGKPVERNVVVLFADLRGYTTLTEGIEARVLVEQVLNRYFTAMTEVLYRHEGTIDKFLGDGLIGVFGTPIAHDDDLIRALHASVDLQRAFYRLKREWRASIGLDIGMGVGISYGPAVVGNIGSVQRTDFTLIGDVVNTANRLSGIAKAGEIIVSHRLIEALPTDYRSPWLIRSAGLVPLKGKQEPHLIYEIEYAETEAGE